MSGEIQGDIGDFYRTARNSLEAVLKKCIEGKDYGEGVKLWAYIAIILNNETDPYYSEVKRYRKKKKEIEFRLKISHREFLEGCCETHLRLLSQSVLRSLELMKDMRIKDFDLDSLTADVTQCLSKYL